MKPLPTSPLARNDRLISALCEDFATPEFLRTGRTPRADAVVRIAKEERR